MQVSANELGVNIVGIGFYVARLGNAQTEHARVIKQVKGHPLVCASCCRGVSQAHVVHTRAQAVDEVRQKGLTAHCDAARRDADRLMRAVASLGFGANVGRLVIDFGESQARTDASHQRLVAALGKRWSSTVCEMLQVRGGAAALGAERIPPLWLVACADVLGRGGVHEAETGRNG